LNNLRIPAGSRISLTRINTKNLSGLLKNCGQGFPALSAVVM